MTATCHEASVRRGEGAAKFRTDTLAQTGGRCAVCGSTDRVEAHHLRGFGEGGGDEHGGVPLCFRCHRRVERAKRRAKAC